MWENIGSSLFDRKLLKMLNFAPSPYFFITFHQNYFYIKPLNRHQYVPNVTFYFNHLRNPVTETNHSHRNEKRKRKTFISYYKRRTRIKVRNKKKHKKDQT